MMLLARHVLPRLRVKAPGDVLRRPRLAALFLPQTAFFLMELRNFCKEALPGGVHRDVVLLDLLQGAPGLLAAASHAALCPVCTAALSFL